MRRYEYETESAWLFVLLAIAMFTAWAACIGGVIAGVLLLIKLIIL